MPTQQTATRATRHDDGETSVICRRCITLVGGVEAGSRVRWVAECDSCAAVLGSPIRWRLGRLVWLESPARLPDGYLRLYEWLAWKRNRVAAPSPEVPNG